MGARRPWLPSLPASCSCVINGSPSINCPVSIFSSTGGWWTIDRFLNQPYDGQHADRFFGERGRVIAMKNVMLFWALIGGAVAQVPTGSIAGIVHDPAGAPVSGARLKVVSLATNLVRNGTSSEQGDYSVPSLPAGEYEVAV